MQIMRCELDKLGLRDELSFLIERRISINRKGHRIKGMVVGTSGTVKKEPDPGRGRRCVWESWTIRLNGKDGACF